MDDGRPITLRGEGEEHRLDHVLATLKERGCSILVDGEVPIGASRAVSRRLFGHPEEPRERVLLRFRQTNSLDGWFPGEVDLAEPGVRVVDCIDPGRSDGTPVRTAGGWHSTFDPAETPSLSRESDVEACTGEIESIAAGARPLSPSQLRVGLFSLDVLDTPEEMVEVVSAVSGAVSAYAGMVHYHLPRPPSRPSVEMVREHVDATITIRKDHPDEPIKQKWTVPDCGETPWIPLTGHG